MGVGDLGGIEGEFFDIAFLGLGEGGSGLDSSNREGGLGSCTLCIEGDIGGGGDLEGDGEGGYCFVEENDEYVRDLVRPGRTGLC